MAMNTLVMLTDILTGMFDNWTYLQKVGLVQFHTKWQRAYVNWLTGFFCLIMTTLSIVEGLLKVYWDTKDEVEATLY